MATDFITRSRDTIRELAAEPAIHAKYTDARLLVYLEQAYAHVFAELMRRMPSPIAMTYDLTLTSPATLTFALPPIMQRVLDVELLGSVNTATGDRQSYGHPQPRSIYAPQGRMWRVVANTLILDNALLNSVQAGATFRITFVPSGAVHLHTGSAGAIVNTTAPATNNCTIVLAAAPTIGVCDNRPNAYVGSVLRILSASTNNYVQERLITAYDVTTRKATLEPAFDAALLPGGATVTYEIAPLCAETMDLPIAIYVARLIVGSADPARYKYLTNLWGETLRDVTLQQSFMNALLEGTQRGTRFSTGRWVENAYRHFGGP